MLAAANHNISPWLLDFDKSVRYQHSILKVYHRLIDKKAEKTCISLLKVQGQIIFFLKNNVLVLASSEKRLMHAVPC